MALQVDRVTVDIRNIFMRCLYEVSMEIAALILALRLLVDYAILGDKGVLPI